MRPSPNVFIERFRCEHPLLGPGVVGEPFGFFVCQSPVSPREWLRIIAGVGSGWEHVSISICDRCPRWEEMAYVKDLFWSSTETVVQFHPPKGQHINYHDFTLHLWRPMEGEIALPPHWMVGPMKETNHATR